jgi:hypothetical protein
MSSKDQEPIVESSHERSGGRSVSVIAANESVRKAHHALGQMFAASDTAEFAAAAAVFLGGTRATLRLLEALEEQTLSLDPERKHRQRAQEQLAALKRHPLETEIQHDEQTGMPIVYRSRLAKGSFSVPKRDPVAMAGLQAQKVSPEEFFFEHADKYSAIELCMDYITRLCALLDER